MRVEANATHLVHTVLASQDGAVMDRLALTKPATWHFAPRLLPGDAAGSVRVPSSSGGGVATA